MPTSVPSPELDESPNRRFLDAAKNGNLTEIKSLLGQVEIDTQDNTIHFLTALHYAAQFGHAEIVNTLIEAGANVDLIDDYGESALMKATGNGNLEIVNSLINAGANIDLIDKFGTALMRAVGIGNLEIVNTLIAHKVDVEKVVDSVGDNALMIAAEIGHLEIVNSLIKAGAKLDGSSNTSDTALMRAAGSGHLEIVETLIAQKADVNKVNLYGESALTRAAKKGHLEIVKTLIAQNADVDKVDKFGTAIMLAISKGHNDIVKLLLGKGANVNLTNKWGETALSCAVVADKEDNVEVVKLLLEKGARTDLRHGDNDKTLLQIIAEKEIHTAEHLIIAKLLLEKGADLEKIGEKHELYPLLKIIGKLTDDEIKVVAENLKDFKTISNNAEAFRIPALNDDLTSKILMYTLDPKEPPYGLGKELTLKIIGILTTPATTSNSSDLLDPTSLGLLAQAPTPIKGSPASRSNPSLNSDGASASPLDSQQISAQARTARPSAPFGKFPPINPVVKADLVFVSGEAKPYAQPSNPHQPPPQASTINSSTHVAKSTQRAEPVVTAQPTSAPVQVADENSSNSPRGVGPGFVQREIARINSLNEGPKSKSR